jgi:predicted RecB family nuclease
MKITNEILESYLACNTKGHLKLAGETGAKSDYEAMSETVSKASCEGALANLVARFGEGDVCRGASVTVETLKQGKPLLADVALDDEVLSLRFDALKRTDGASRLGDHHYLPVLHNQSDQIGRKQRLLLAVFGLVLVRVQGQRPAIGLVARGSEGRLGKALLDAKLYREAERVLDEIKQLQARGEPPKLILNDHCQMCEFRQRCHAQAVREDSLSLLRGIGEKEIKNLGRKGILTLTQLAHTFRPKRKGKRKERKAGRRFHALKALAIRDKKIYVLGSPQLPESPVQAYLDIEGVPDKGLVYLIGLKVVTNGAEERFSFWADAKEHEAGIYERMLDVLSRHGNFVLFSYGSYEKAFLARMGKQTARKELAERVLKSLVNVLSVVHAHIYFPCFSNGLKDVAGHLGHCWADKSASGIQSLVWRSRWEATREPVWKQKLVAYNLDDCGALRRVVDLIRSVVARMSHTAGTTTSGPDLPPLGFVADLDKLAQSHHWGKVNYVHPDYEFINDCAYFDYQRERVFVRTNKILRKRKAKQGDSRNRNRRFRVAQRVSILSQECPFCKGKKLVLVPRSEQVKCRRQRSRKVFDLVITPSGMRRKVVEYLSDVHRCLSCNKDFVPEQHKQMDSHSHSLKSWAMYQHVAHRLSLGTLQIMFEEFFGLRIGRTDIHQFKSLMAHYYQGTYQGLLDKILAGGLLHIDETEVQLKTGKAYVWVFTSLENVVFMLRPNREGDFLKELLKGFKGVLVSDFYAAYDSIECPQQKCLIHLIRDINQELLNNPFDEELQSITRPFGALLRTIVTTVDQHGLKRQYLERHKREVDAFFCHLRGQTLRSEAAESVRTRLEKYRDKLFTFVGHDGVPWNNTNAEHAIKQFAYYREDTVGLMKEFGLKNYLMLLSICHTCRYKGVSFLKFLLSKELDVAVYCEGKRKKRQASSIEA